ncbi:MAG: DUF4160 domain-containing protein [Acetobacteraceae bacterium]
MPAVLRADGHRVYFYSHEANEPPHVHVDRGGASARVWLDGIALLASNAGFSARELGEVLRLARTRQVQFLEAWHGFFGTDGGP